MTVSETKSPGWMRAVQIGLGIIALILSGYVLAFPAMTPLVRGGVAGGTEGGCCRA